MIFIASDHAGFKLKSKIIEMFKKEDYEFVDLGTNSEARVDYPVYCKELVAKLEDLGEDNYGILICGTGIGMSICANRNSNIRGALCKDVKTARLSREHNNANVLILAGRSTSSFKAKKMVKVFLDTAFLGGRHENRLSMIDKNLQN